MKTLPLLFGVLLALSRAEGQEPPREEPKAPPPDPFVVKVTDLVRARIAALVTKATGSKVKFEDAVAMAAKGEETVLAEAAEKLELPVDQVRDAWSKRERKVRKLTYGDGSWIVLGGQDGGLDSTVMGRPAESGELIPSGPSILTRRKAPPPAEPVPMGKPLKTRVEWWASATSSERSAFVEGELVRKSALFSKQEDAKKCATCNAKGAVNVNRGGLGLTVICSRCHGAKDDVLLVFE